MITFYIQEGYRHFNCVGDYLKHLQFSLNRWATHETGGLCMTILIPSPLPLCMYAITTTLASAPFSRVGAGGAQYCCMSSNIAIQRCLMSAYGWHVTAATYIHGHKNAYINNIDSILYIIYALVFNSCTLKIAVFLFHCTFLFWVKLCILCQDSCLYSLSIIVNVAYIVLSSTSSCV